MSNPSKSKHASPSGAELFPENRIPSAKGNYDDSFGNSTEDETFDPVRDEDDIEPTRTPMFPLPAELLADALAVYQGETPSEEWCVSRVARKRNLVGRLGQTSLPELTPDILQVLYPDIDGQSHDEEYNSSTVLERALRDLLCNIIDDDQELQKVENPRYRAELHAAQRRTLAYTLGLSGVVVPGEPRKRADRRFVRGEKSASDLRFEATSSTCLPEPIRVAKALVNGKYPTAEGFELTSLDMRSIDETWPAYLFWPEEEIADVSKPGTKSLLAVGLKLEGREEEAALSLDPSPLRSAILSRIYETAAKEGAKVLFDLSNEARVSTLRNCRLRARLCQAVREELAALVDEWDELTAEVA